jgi:hypothetical protein
MNTRLKNNRGVLLIVASVVMLVIAVLTAVYLSTIVSEKHSVDIERYSLQVINLAEAGSNQAWAELRDRINTDLRTRMETYTPLNQQGTMLAGYDTASDSLQFLADYAYSAGTPQFIRSGNEVKLVLNSTVLQGLNDLSTAIGGSIVYANITITAAQAPVINTTSQVFKHYYLYSIEATAQIDAVNPPMQKVISFSPNAFNVTVHQDNFAKYALFTFHHKTPSGTTVWFTQDTNFYGPVHTNERFSFANNPSAHFTTEVTQTNSTARFYNNGNSVLLSDEHNGVRDVPVFDAGFSRSKDAISLPTSVSSTDLSAQALGGTAIPGAGVTIPIDSSSNLIGGIYIRGSTSSSSDNPSIAMSVVGSNQVFTITQHLHPVDHTTVVTVNNTANTTTVVRDGGAPSTYNGKPDGIDNEGIIIHTNDTINNFSGTVQQDTQITLSGERDVIINNNVHYEGSGTSPMLNATGYNNLLGILSWNGNIRVGTAAPDDIEICAVVMAPNGIFTVDSYDSGSSRGTASLLGGVITNYYGAFGTFSGTSGMRTGYGRNFIYDNRVLEGMAPPYFPYMDKYTIDTPSELAKKTIWREKDSADE